MKLSVLLPTRNGLDYLPHAVETVRRQEDDNWELVISDNDSDQDIAGYVASLQDDRIVYVRTDTAVPVTENWNNALRHSSGDYTVMLGDDDALLPGYLTHVRQLIETHQQPDAIYTSALLFAYPGVDPSAPDGYLQDYGYARFLRGLREPAWLAREEAHRLVTEAMDFKVRFGFNMQFALISRRIAESIAGGGDFFRSPFPDYYAMNMLLLRAERILIDPRPGVVVGMTPKSYGFFHANALEAEAKALLASIDDTGAERRLEDELLPGTNINTGWLLAMEAVRADAGDATLRPNLGRYRRLQALYTYQHHHLTGTISDQDFATLRDRLGRFERVPYDVGFTVARLLRPLVPARLRAAIGYAFAIAQRQTPHWAPPKDTARYADVLEVFERSNPQALAAKGAR